MRQLIKNYTFTPLTRSIYVEGNDFDLADVRLIINETKKVPITSSMFKENIVSVVNKTITFANALPVLDEGDILTIEIDYGYIGADALMLDVYEGKGKIVEAVVDRGGTAEVTDSYDTIANQVRTAMLPDVNITPLNNFPTNWHDLFAAMAANYDHDYPYMYSLLLTRDTPRQC